MRLKAARIRNYRSIEAIHLDFHSTYTAICGPNDSGKTNVVRALRAIVRGDIADSWFSDDDDEFFRKDNYPKWLDGEQSKNEMAFELILELDRARDIGFYQFLKAQLSLSDPVDPLEVAISAQYKGDRPDPIVDVKVGGASYTGIDAGQILKKLQSSKIIIFHNSTETATGYIYSRRSVVGHIRDITGTHENVIESLKKQVSKGLARISRSQQAELENLLGRLKTKYKVGLSMAPFDLSYVPFSVTLGDRQVEVPLEDWGSGTRNRTMILLALFRAKQIATSEPSASKVTPVLIIEEPESFLHPSAQAEFGRVLQDLSEEFKVQVLVTTHSPYLLNLRDPDSNILLCRRTSYNQVRGTERVDTGGDSWMTPFGKALEIDTEEFKPWKDMLLAKSDCLLLVEGDTDKAYFEMLRKEGHGANRLSFSGDIIPYNGVGSLSNTVLLNFVKNTRRKFFVTYDLDASERIEKTLKSLQLEKGKHYLPIGQNAAGRRNVEGLLPDVVLKAVHEANADLVQAAAYGSRDEQDNARRRLKRKFLEHFRSVATPGTEYFGRFYSIVKTINRALT
jgi:energy-coupling factor transporter ATP-binding protein EcfA2